MACVHRYPLAALDVARHFVRASLVAVLALGCEPPKPELDAGDVAAEKVAIIGWDAANWEVLDPMLENGELPTLAALLARGSRGVLVAEEPLLSPVAWTTLATGFHAQDHGILNFTMRDLRGGDEQVLVTSGHRKRAPLWKMVSGAGRSVGFVGWWTTWPAEPVNGFMVSDHLAFNRWDTWARRVTPEGASEDDGLTWPAELAGELRSHARRPETIELETLTGIVAFNEREQREMMSATQPVLFHGPSVFHFGYSTDASNLAFARYLLEERGQPDLFATVFVLSDIAGHVFWHHYEPDRFAEFGAEDAHLRDAIPSVYRQLDRWTAELIAEFDSETTIVIVSDHGMGPEGVVAKPGVNPAGDHVPEGILVVAGPSSLRGADLGDVASIDFAPAVLSLLGLPAAEDMPGSAPWRTVGAAAKRIESYGDGRSELDVRAGERSSGEAEYLERLRALGYIK